LQIRSLGEANSKQEFLNFKQKLGLQIDPADEPLIGKAETFLILPQEFDKDKLKAYRAKLRSVSLHGNHTFETPRIDLTEYAQKLLEMRREEFDKLQILQGEVCAIKQDFVEPLFHFLGDLGLLLGLEECNTLDLIKQVPLFTTTTKKLLKECISELYTLRVRLHVECERIQEEASLAPSLELPVLQQHEKEALRKVHLLALLPLYQANLEEVDLLKLALQQPTVEIVRLAATFLQHSPIEIHRTYYQMLNSPDQVELQALYINHVPQEIQRVLREIPNRAGYRQSRKTEDQKLRRRLSLITTEDPSSGVKIQSPLLDKELYLKPNAVKDLIGSKGHIQKKYRNSLHNVSAHGDLHFKELPYQPLMEYAIHSLTHRIMGKATPAITLARIEIPDKKLVYPVVISETISGKEIDPEENLDKKHLTWLRLCEILTKPGDGRLSNYVERAGKVYPIDNDIAFMEPVILDWKWQRKVSFCSTLFILNIPLDKGVLHEFCQLEPDLILTNWLEELQKQEETYLSLFPDPKELQTFYEQDEDKRFTPNLLFAKGAISTLCMQFYHLQDVLRNQAFENPLLLLRELITLQNTEKNPVGLLIERQYQKAIAQPFEKRLEVATVTRTDQSMTSQKAMQLNYKTIPTFEEIQKRKTYSLQEALQELCLLEIQKLWNQVFITKNSEEYSLEADFSSVEDPEREELLLKALQFLYEAEKQKPISITLRNTKTLTPAILGELLHPGLRSLDLSYGALVSDTSFLLSATTLSQIEMLSPHLEELHLEGCPALRNPVFNLPKLKKLNLSHCSNLVSFKRESFTLQKLKVNHCPKLTTVTTTLSADTNIDWKETPNLNNKDFVEQLYQLGKQYAEGNGVPKDLERAVVLWEKVVEGNHSQVQYQLGKQYAEGDGVPKDPEKAIALWKKAAKNGYKHAQKIIEWTNRLSEETTLNQWNNNIGGYGAQAIAESLKVNASLTSLDLFSNDIGDYGAQAIAESLKVNTSLTYLNLTFNDIGDYSAQAIAESLKVNTSLTYLNLAANNIGDYGAHAIAEALKVNTSLTSLHLKCDKIGDNGAHAIAESLKVNTSLTNLDLSSNNIENNGAHAIAEALKVNASLTNLNLESNHIGENGANAIVESLKINTSLTNLGLGGNNIRMSYLKLIEEIIRRNKSLQNSAFQAAGKGDWQLLELLGQGVSLYSQDSAKNTILHLATSCGNIALARALLERSKNPAFKKLLNDKKQTALDLAKKGGHHEIATLLDEDEGPN
ncbi:MAG: hypothetical protein K940chlam9_01796, partial [Chlamydiae bacterium]|nr:hypothetical protein [Chlamydiota bacterium]